MLASDWAIRSLYRETLYTNFTLSISTWQSLTSTSHDPDLSSPLRLSFGEMPMGGMSAKCFRETGEAVIGLDTHFPFTLIAELG